MRNTLRIVGDNSVTTQASVGAPAIAIFRHSIGMPTQRSTARTKKKANVVAKKVA